MKKSFLYFYTSALLFLLMLMSGLTSCYETNYYRGQDASLRFSADTLVFDTVFTTVGSATRILKVFNDLDEAVEISSIMLEKGSISKFRLNIDGLQGPAVENIEIGPRDSVYIFGEVTVDPDEPLSISPFVIDDYILFNVNGNQQKVLLEAWGQNANYLPGKEAKGKAYLSTCDMGVQLWDDPKPYVIYGTILYDSCTVEIPAGTQVFVHGGFAKSESGQEYNDGQLYFLKDASLIINGSEEEPVVFQTDRLEHKYNDISGLWSGLYFLDGSKGHQIKNAVLKNANIGIYLDSAVEMSLENTKILHNITAGIYARQAKLDATNCLIADSGGYGLAFRYGGNYNLDFCTVANYDNQEEAIYMGNYQCLDFLCNDLAVSPIQARFRNCIFYGNGDDELFFENALPEDPNAFVYEMENCLIAVEEQLKIEAFLELLENCQGCFNGAGEENLFMDIAAYDFRPDTLAIVIDQGIVIPGISGDIEGNLRDANPDMGCYEFF